MRPAHSRSAAPHAILAVLLSAALTMALLQSIGAARAQGNSPANQPLAAGETLHIRGPAPGPLQTVHTGADGVIFELKLPAPQFLAAQADGQPCQVLQIHGFAERDAPGAPRLPVAGRWVGLPPGVGEPWAAIEVETAEISDLPGEYRLCPGSAPQVEFRDGEPVSLGEQARWDLAAYALDAFAPTAPVELATSGYMRGQRLGLVRFQPFQYNPASGKLRYYTRLRVRLRFTPEGAAVAKPAELRGPAAPDDGPFEPVLRLGLVNYADAYSWRGPAPQPATFSLPGIDLRADETAGATRVQLLVDADGLYRVTGAQLQAAGVPLVGLASRTLQLTNLGAEVALQVEDGADGAFGSEDALIFFGQAATGRWTRRNVYWLSWGGAQGLRMTGRAGSPVSAYSEPSGYRDFLRVEKNNEYLSSRPSGSDADRWYWNLLTASDALASTRTFTYTYTITPTQPLAEGEALLSVALLGLSAAPEHHLRFQLNGALLGEARWPAQAARTVDLTLPQALLHTGGNALQVILPMADVTYESFYLNRFELTYMRRFQAVDDVLAFSAPAGQATFQVGGFSSPALSVYDITNPALPVRIDGVAVSASSGSYQVRFEVSTDTLHRYLVAGPRAWRTPTLRRVELAGLAAPANAADYILITPPEFMPAAQTLAAYRAAQGLRVRIVTTQQIYDEFGAGLVDPQAIRSFLAYAYAAWQPPAPGYVLLLGDGHFDPLDYKGLHAVNWIPPYLADVDYWIGETAADNRYVSVVGDDPLPDMALGRLPARSLAEAQTMVTKTINYETRPASGDWNRRILFVADNADSAGDFAALSDQIVGPFAAAPYRADRVYLGVTTTQPAQATQAIVAAINAGRLLVSYVGHGAVRWWGNEMLFGRDQLAQLSNTGRLAVMLPMTCLDGYYIWPTSPAQEYSALGEALVALPGGGAVASFSPTGFGVASGHDILERGFFQAALRDYMTEMGPATLQAKLYLYGETTGFTDLVETYTLFGDPALRLPVARPRLEVRQHLVSWLAPPGETLSFTLLMTNTGEMTATQSRLIDALPATWADLSTAVFTAIGTTAAPRPDAPAFAWDLSDLAPGATARITMRVRTLPGAGPLVPNTASISAFGALPGPHSSYTAQLPLNSFSATLPFLLK